MIERFYRVLFRPLAFGLFMVPALSYSPAAQACGPYCDMPGDRGGKAFAAENAVACESACDRTQGCAGWTWVKPGVQGPQAVCWVKTQVVKTMRSNCCISGYRGDRTAANSVRRFNWNAPAEPARLPPPPPTTGQQGPAAGSTKLPCNCQDQSGKWFHEWLGQCGPQPTSLANYDCR